MRVLNVSLTGAYSHLVIPNNPKNIGRNVSLSGCFQHTWSYQTSNTVEWANTKLHQAIPPGRMYTCKKRSFLVIPDSYRMPVKISKIPKPLTQMSPWILITDRHSKWVPARYLRLSLFRPSPRLAEIFCHWGTG